MDVDWATQRLREYLEICEQVRWAVPPGDVWNNKATELNEMAELRLATVERIVSMVEPSIELPILPPNYSHAGGDEKVRKALGSLIDRADTEAFLSPESPELPADHFHPLIWKSASTTWNTRQYRVAVGQAALSLATQIKTRAHSKLTDRKLMQDAFAPEIPKVGVTRLHFPGDREDEMWKSRQAGLHLLAQGAYAGIRNTAAHHEEALSEHRGLEYLAVLSVIARWFDETEQVTNQSS